MTPGGGLLPRTRAAAVPAAAWLLPEVGVGFPAEHRDAARLLREHVHDALATLAGALVVVVLVDDGAPAPGATIAPTVSLAPLGVVAANPRAAPPEVRLEWVDTLAAALPVPHRDDRPVGPQERVLRLLLAAHPATVDATVVAVDLGPAGAPQHGLRPVDLLRDVLGALVPDVVEDEAVAVVVPGDLTAAGDEGSPRHRVDGAAGASAALAAAILAGDAPTAVETAPDDRFVVPGRRSLGALRAALTSRRRAPATGLDLVVRHVHHLCATWPAATVAS